ncbi:WxL domain-containing protein [Enterococcus quebecensis]|uniref:WxL domain-containing protein n=1 Tax=Enterococcus quebecensis TaxID=903983 RepID=A0A1E5GZJ0_9ENTE|nr:WxL domain-containing protein [Enterococcus quebecensis]OEG18097.1 hypothetical protein BCR23_14225 [Enterococcus quebecensis]OJG71512.1 hypothetical protein RV12_GL001520 [Enterococcus quebecensis]
MKKITLTTAALLISTTVLGALPAFAVEIPATTNAKVSFKADDQGDGSSTDPTDPEGGGITPDPGEGTSTKGPLRFDFVPNLSFGEQKISGGDKTYHPLMVKATTIATGEKPAAPKYVPHYVQVTDNRGTNEGWNVTVSRTDFKTPDETDEVLGATLTLANGNIKGNLDADASLVPTIPTKDGKAEVITISDTASNVMTAAANKGMGSWVTSYGSEAGTSATDVNTNITLAVPAKSKKYAKAYTSTITWTLASTPTSK